MSLNLRKKECSRNGCTTLARAAAAIGVAGIFMEVHPDPDKAPCDGPNMLALKDLPAFLRLIREFDALAKGACA